MNTAFKAFLAILALGIAVSCTQSSGRPRSKEAPSSAALLESTARVPVEGHPEVSPFDVASRTPLLKRAPCNKCHTVALPQMKPVKPAAHWNVTVKHAKAETMNCQTCHADAQTGELKLMQGAAVSFDHAYKVCGQCHMAQERDWAGGAHGKRAAGWAPPRVSLSCTGCHDPHKPAFEKRWPARAGRTEPME